MKETCLKVIRVIGIISSHPLRPEPCKFKPYRFKLGADSSTASLCPPDPNWAAFSRSTTEAFCNGRPSRSGFTLLSLGFFPELYSDLKAMDPLTALGVASNALSFVDFALKLIKGSQAIYKSFQPGSNHTAFLDTIARDCRSINDRIIHSFGCSKELESIIEKTKEIANELQDALGKLMVQGRKTRWKSFLLAIKEVMTHRDVEDMSNRLQMLQSHISMHLQLLVRYASLVPYFAAD